MTENVGNWGSRGGAFALIIASQAPQISNIRTSSVWVPAYKNACHQAVRKDLSKEKELNFKQFGDQLGQVSCELSGKMISIKEAHVDHMPPVTFEVIVESFIKANGITPQHNMLTAKEDAQFSTSFSDKELEIKFREYHHKFAKIRIVAATENWRAGPQQRIRDAQRPVII